jgi:copper chaperone for superoxide dismutase
MSLIDFSIFIDCVFSGQNLGAAVSIMDRKDTPVTGMTRILQLSEDLCLFEGTIDGLLPGEHGVFIHELGDLSEGCER